MCVVRSHPGYGACQASSPEAKLGAPAGVCQVARRFARGPGEGGKDLELGHLPQVHVVGEKLLFWVRSSWGNLPLTMIVELSKSRLP